MAAFRPKLLALVAALSLAACVKKGGEAVVLAKDYLPATYSEDPEQEPRMLIPEQWIVKVRMLDDRRIIDVRVDPPEWEKAQAGDRVRVNYSRGKYTGTVWYSELKQP